MGHIMHFMKTGCTSKISQISGFLKHIPKKNLIAYFYLSELIQKNHFALTDPVWARIDLDSIMILKIHFEEAEKLFLAALANTFASQS